MTSIRKSIFFLQQHMRNNGDSKNSQKALDLLVLIDKEENQPKPKAPIKALEYLQKHIEQTNIPEHWYENEIADMMECYVDYLNQLKKQR